MATKDSSSQNYTAIGFVFLWFTDTIYDAVNV